MASGIHGFGTFTALSTLAAILFVLLHAFQHLRRTLLGGDIPPGPRGVPILGRSVVVGSKGLNSLQATGSFAFLTRYPELTLHRWAQKFGPLYSMWLGNQLFVVVSDPQIVKDLAITNSTIFSSRKEMYMKSEIIFARRGITATPYDETWCVCQRQAVGAVIAVAGRLMQSEIGGNTAVWPRNS